MMHAPLLIDIALDDTMLSVYSQYANTVDSDVQRYILTFDLTLAKDKFISFKNNEKFI